jgi:hypothetical protein
VAPGGSACAGLAPHQSCYWSDMYRSHPRTPHDTTAAPWVLLGK